MSQVIKQHEKQLTKIAKLSFGIGDVIKVPVKIKEGNKERIQSYEGTVIAIKGASANQTFTVRRLVAGVGVERTFLVNSPRLGEIVTVRKNQTRRAKLYYLRDLIGNKATRLKENKKVYAQAPVATPAVQAETPTA